MASNWSDSISSELAQVEVVMERSTASAENPQLREMCQYVIGNHGKRVRPAFCILSYYMLGGKEPARAIDIGAAVELIHNATLIHDDINDEGEMRRGAKALYKEYSLGKSIVAGDFMFALGFKLLGSSSNDVIGYVIDAAAAMGSGEFDQKKYERNVSVDEAAYIKIITGKTARLIECSAKCGAYAARPGDIDAVIKMGDIAFNIGCAFQIIDDLLDVIGDPSKTGKKVGNDLVEGKPTIPTIYGMQDLEVGPRIREIFESKSTGYEEAYEAIGLIKKTDAVERCYALANKYADEALNALEDVEDSEYKQAMTDLVKFIVTRNR